MNDRHPTGVLAPTDAAPDAFAPEQLRSARRCLALLGVLGAGSMVGVAFSLYLVNHAPLLLVGISPLGRHIVLAAPTVDPIALVTVVTIRRIVFYLACFYLGRALGPAGIAWIENRAGLFGRFVRFVESWFERAPRLVVLVGAGPTVAMLAGIAGLKPLTFALLALPSLVGRLLFMIGFAEWLRAPIEMLLELIEEIWVPGTVVMVLVVSLWEWRRRRRRTDDLAELPPASRTEP